jgi:hypothetical protein
VHGNEGDARLTPPARPTGAEEPPPVLGSWPALYTVVIVELLGIIALCGWLSRQR